MCGGDMCGARVETECQLLLPSRHQQSRHTAAGATHLQLARTDINIHSGALAKPRIVAEVWYTFLGGADMMKVIL